jgi:nucleoside-diphosphate-sugar epimerase
VTQAQKILVTGASGRLGSAILHALGHDKAIAATRSYAPELEGFQQLNLSEGGLPPAELLMKCSAVVNAAGSVSSSQEGLRAANVDFPLRIARAARENGVKKFLQVSSFSVLGTTERISADSPIRPSNSYGCSKAEAEEKLMALATKDFSTECVRFPFMFSAQQPGLLKNMLQMVRLSHFVPQYRNIVMERSMITYSAAAKHLLMRIYDSYNGVTFCADTELFNYKLLKSILKNTVNFDMAIIKIPHIFEYFIKMLAKNHVERILHSSVLDPNCNLFDNKYSEISKELKIIINKEFCKI